MPATQNRPNKRRRPGRPPLDLRSTPLAPPDAAALRSQAIEYRGWRIAELAIRWNLPPRKLYRWLADPMMASVLHDAIAALPRRKPASAEPSNPTRIRAPARVRTVSLQWDLLAPGSLVTVAKTLNEDLEEGAIGVVIERIEHPEQYQIGFETGLTDLFPVKAVEDYLVPQGRDIEGGATALTPSSVATRLAAHRRGRLS